MARPSQPLVFLFWFAVYCCVSHACYGQAPSGVYTGFVESGNPIGFVHLALSRAGSGTLQVKIAGEPSFSTKVEVDSSGDILTANGSQSAPFSLAIDSQGNISGTVTVDGQAEPVTLVNAAPTAFAMNAAGSYTLVLDDGVHLGFGSLHISQSGSARLSLSLLDGPTLTQGGTLNGDGDLPIFTTAGSYLLTGPVQFANETATDCTGSLTLVHFADTSTQQPVNLSGSLYQADLGFALSGWTIYFSAGSTSSLPAQLGGLSFADKAHTRLVGNSAGTRVGLRLNPTSGALNGSASVSTSAGNVTFVLKGVIFQKTGAPVGTIFAGGASVGEFSLGVPVASSPTEGGGGTLILNGATTITAAGSNGGIVNLRTPISSGGTLTLTGSLYSGGTVALSAAPIVLSPYVPTSGSILVLSDFNPILNNGGATVTLTSGGTLGTFSGGLTISGGSVLTLGGTITGSTILANGTAGAGTILLNGTIGAFTGAVTISGATLEINPSTGGLIVANRVGAGTLVLTGNNNYFGSTTITQGTPVLNPTTTGSITLNSGALTTVGSGALQFSGATTTLTGGTLNLTAGTANTFTGTLVSGGTVLIDDSAGVTFGSVISGQ